MWPRILLDVLVAVSNVISIILKNSENIMATYSLFMVKSMK